MTKKTIVTVFTGVLFSFVPFTSSIGDFAVDDISLPYTDYEKVSNAIDAIYEYMGESGDRVDLGATEYSTNILPQKLSEAISDIPAGQLYTVLSYFDESSIPSPVWHKLKLAPFSKRTPLGNVEGNSNQILDDSIAFLEWTAQDGEPISNESYVNILESSTFLYPKETIEMLKIHPRDLSREERVSIFDRLLNFTNTYRVQGNKQELFALWDKARALLEIEDLNQVDKQGRTWVKKATTTNNPDLAEYLLMNGASREDRDAKCIREKLKKGDLDELSGDIKGAIGDFNLSFNGCKEKQNIPSAVIPAGEKLVRVEKCIAKTIPSIRDKFLKGSAFLKNRELIFSKLVIAQQQGEAWSDLSTMRLTQQQFCLDSLLQYDVISEDLKAIYSQSTESPQEVEEIGDNGCSDEVFTHLLNRAIDGASEANTNVIFYGGVDECTYKVSRELNQVVVQTYTPVASSKYINQSFGGRSSGVK